MPEQLSLNCFSLMSRLSQRGLRGHGKQGASAVQSVWSPSAPLPSETAEHLPGPPLDRSAFLFSYNIDASQFVSRRTAFLFMLHIP